MMNINEIQAQYVKAYINKVNPRGTKEVTERYLLSLQEVVSYVFDDIKHAVTGVDEDGNAMSIEYENYPYFGNLVVANASMETIVDFMVDNNYMSVVYGDGQSVNKLHILTVMSTLACTLPQVNKEDKEYLIKQMEYITV